MRKRFQAGLFVISGLMMMAFATTSRADEVEIPAKKLPDAILKAIKAEFPKAEIEKASKEEEDGVTTYEVELEVDDAKIDVSMKADGTILEIEKEVSFKSLPKAVKKAIKAKYPKAEIAKVEAITKGKNGTVTYEVALAVEVVFTAKGKLVKTEDDEEEDEDDDNDKEMKSKKEKKDVKAKKKDMDDEEDEDDDDDKEMKSKKGKKDNETKAKKKDKEEDDEDEKEMKSKKKKAEKDDN